MLTPLSTTNQERVPGPDACTSEAVLQRAHGVAYSRGRHTRDNRPEQRTAQDFNEFVEAIVRDISPRKGLAYICAPLASSVHSRPAQYQGIAAWRQRCGVQPRRFVALDLDGFAAPSVFDAVCNFLSNLSALVYTTASSTKEAPRARVIVELSRAVDRADGIRVSMALQTRIEHDLGTDRIKFDASVYRGEQPVYTPVIGARIFHYQRQPLDVDKFIARWRPSSTTGTGRAKVLANRPRVEETPRARAMLVEQLRHIDADCSYEAYRNIVWAILSTGWDSAESIARGWCKSAPERFDDLSFDRVAASFDPDREDCPTLGTVWYYAAKGGWRV
jgi:hypothetical protein